MLPLGIAPLLVILANQPSPTGACPRDSAEHYEPRTFLGYACYGECEQHKAGFAWAESRRPADAAACDSLPPLAAEGCRIYVDEPLSPERIGQRWAVENEINRRCACDGAGERFRRGCLEAVLTPSGALP
jgi:hypothetical protein